VPRFFTIGRTTVDIPVWGGPGAPEHWVEMPWRPTFAGHQCVQVELAYGNDPFPYNNHAAKNLRVQGSPVTFEVRNTMTATPALIRFITTFRTPGHPSNTVVLQPSQLMLGPDDCPRKVHAEILRAPGVCDEVDASIEAIIETEDGPVSLGGVTVRAADPRPRLNLMPLPGGPPEERLGELAWNGVGLLETAPQLTGPWLPLPGATSPHQVPLLGPAGFFRVLDTNGCAPPCALTIVRQPEHAIEREGENATFAVEAWASEGPFVYQWQRGAGANTFTNIPGATNASYTLPNVTAADHRAFFRAAVTNRCDGKVSQPARLTVICPSVPVP
jgi:hypothetical protein